MLLVGSIICLVGGIGGISRMSKVEVSNVDLKYDVRNLWYSQCIKRIQRIIKVRNRRKKPPDIIQQQSEEAELHMF